MSFTDRQIAAFKTKSQRYEKMEPARTGLGMRVTPRGIKTWTYRYRFAGEQKRMVFGNYPLMRLSAAHKALADARDKLARGIDPGVEIAQERAAERNAETVAEMADEYIRRHCEPNLKPSTTAENRRLLDRNVLPKLGKLKARDITRRDLILLLDGIMDRGTPVSRNRVAGVLSGMFNMAMDRGIVNASPASGIRREKEGGGRERFLTAEEIHSLWNRLDDADMFPQLRLAIRFALVSGQRRSEVAGASRAEIDDAEALWTLPGERAKNGKENLIPLPPLVMALVEEAGKYRVRPVPARLNRKDRPAYDAEPSPFLFPSRVVGESIKPAALTRALNRNREKLGIGDATVHDLRRSFATAHGELGTPPDVIAGLLNHTVPGVTARYNRAVNLARRREAMTRWCAWLALVIDGNFKEAEKMREGAEVISLEHATA